jgi:hypothetical protein
MGNYRRKPKVTWKEPEVYRTSHLRPYPYIPNTDLMPGTVETYMTSLVPGALFVTTNILRPDERYNVGYEKHPHAYLHADPYSWGTSVTYPVGTVAVYAGQVRVEEADRRGDKMRVPRHSFIVGGVQYITTNLNDFKPA